MSHAHPHRPHRPVRLVEASCPAPDRRSDDMWVVVAPEAARASIEAAVRQLDDGQTPARVSFAWSGQEHGHDRPGVFVKAGPVLLWAVDPYEGERLDRAFYGSEVGCRLGDD